VHIEWTDKDPESGAKRTVRAERFARKWTFRVQFGRYTNWRPVPRPSADMLETLLDALERRLPRREGVTDDDVKQVRAALAAEQQRAGDETAEGDPGPAG
jgi:hypothetical protein